MKKILYIIAVVVVVVLAGYAVLNISDKSNMADGKISIVTTLFPQYDFAKVIGGDKVNVTLLLPPGVEAHSYEPKPSDISKINKADIFVYTGEFMEPWAHDIIEGADKNLTIVDVSKDVNLREEEEGDDHGEDEIDDHGGVDPHFWLDFENSKIMAENITKALIEVDPENTDYYKSNLDSYTLKLTELDSEYKKTISTCKSKTIIYGGHYAFGYLANRYDLKYVSAQGFSPDSEPTAKDLISLVEQIKKDNIGYIFYEELTSPKIAETLSKETNTKLLLLNGAHNLAKDDYKAGASFISFMKGNLENIAIGLDCQK